MNADIGALESCVRDCEEQLKVERAKSEQLELIVSFFTSFHLVKMFVVAWAFLLHREVLAVYMVSM